MRTYPKPKDFGELETLQKMTEHAQAKYQAAERQGLTKACKQQLFEECIVVYKKLQACLYEEMDL